MVYTMEDFNRQFIKDNVARLTPEEQREIVDRLPLEVRLAGLSAEQIQQYLDQLAASGPAAPRPRRRKR